MKKQASINKQLSRIEKCLSDAENYVIQNADVEGRTFLHLDDWHGKSGHPLWMKNHMIPATKRFRARKEKALKLIDAKEKDKELTLRKLCKGQDSLSKGECD